MRRLGDLARVLRAGPPIIPRAYSTASPGELAIAADLPGLLKDRKIFITAAARSAGQQGHMMTSESGAPVWRIELDTQHKWINGLMGWTSTADPLENVNRSNLVFQTKEAAIDYAEKYGLQYEVVEPNERRRQRPKRYPGYGDNFSTKRKGLPAGGLPSEQERGQKK